MPPGHETPRACRGGAPRAGGAVRALLATCASSPCASKVRGKSEAFPLRGLGPPRTERVRGMASVGRSGPGEVLQIVIGSGRPEPSLRQQVCTVRSKNNTYVHRGTNCSNKSCQQSYHSYILRVYTLILQFALCFTLAF